MLSCKYLSFSGERKNVIHPEKSNMLKKIVQNAFTALQKLFFFLCIEVISFPISKVQA